MNLMSTVYVVDDDVAVRNSLGAMFEAAGFAVETFESATMFLLSFQPNQPCCVVLDMCMPGMSGAELQTQLARHSPAPPIIFLTAHGDIPMCVQAMKSGAVDFLTKPADGAALLLRVRAALARGAGAFERLSKLTQRERALIWRMASGASNKEIARSIGISHRTVEVHRGRIMRKLGLRSVLELAELARSFGMDRQSMQRVQ